MVAGLIAVLDDEIRSWRRRAPRSPPRSRRPGRQRRRGKRWGDRSDTARDIAGSLARWVGDPHELLQLLSYVQARGPPPGAGSA